MIKLIPAPIDNKNLMEDGFEDDVFKDFYYAPDHRKYSRRHLIGFKGETYVDVSWNFGSCSICIEVIAANPCENYEEVANEVLSDYVKQFWLWQCPENPGLVVKFLRESNVTNALIVSFYFEVENDVQ